ncbi:SDR family oxidoreductase [Actinobacteria bacterium YIM 96077]|uniref:Short-chain dehydrogenase n=1 Tax=Phytoactinopolyspora halophila TaxID=1981511 RepID=A0A329R265_9ACTN|nr:SDR family oxidoreductase [Phytoactinopolyspora halophila]AYY13189.1 SDR family oxidoreductase [Actinobacteria bacterium YIM 96077]RAW17572.1 short-chain dehydrogenase [Phytoactinopolyspora halophila]
MTQPRAVLVIGGTSGIGLEVVRHFAAAGDDVVLTGRDGERAESIAKSVAQELDGRVRGIALDLTRVDEIAAALSGIERVDDIVLAAVDRDHNTAADYDTAAAQRLVTLKLVGYTEVVHAVLPRMSDDGSIVVFGGLAKDRPYPGSTTVSTVNGGVIGMVHTLANELAPIRVNAVHPAIVGDSPFWSGKPPEMLDGFRSRTPTGRLTAMADVVDAVAFLLRNGSVNGVNLNVDGGWLLK